MNIVVSPYVQPVPRVQHSPSYKAGTDKGIADMNAWLVKMFGKEDRALVIGGTVFVSHSVYRLMGLV
jgi:hypothetical protein